MIKSLIKLAALLVVCILVYNYCFGTTSEKQQSREVFGKFRDLVVAGAGVLKSEKQKFDAGKYDQLMDQLGSAYQAVRARAKYVDEHVLDKLDDLEQRKATLERELETIQRNEPNPSASGKPTAKTQEQQASKAADQQRRKEKLQRELEALYKDSEELLEDAQQK